MAKIILITGGVSSGKSQFACQIAKENKKVVFVATADCSDMEMKKKINKHKETRNKSWKTIEPKDVSLINHKITAEILIIDCMTMYISRLFYLLKKSDIKIFEIVLKLLRQMKFNNKVSQLIIVTNEVGMGIVPRSKAGRRFRELLGQVNKIIAQQSDEVFFMVSGIPQKIK